MPAPSGHAIRGLPPATDELGAPEGPTKADVKAQSRRAAQAQRAAALAAYRTLHDLPASMSDATVWALCVIAQCGKPGAATAADSRREHETREEPKHDVA